MQDRRQRSIAKRFIISALHTPVLGAPQCPPAKSLICRLFATPLGSHPSNQLVPVGIIWPRIQVISSGGQLGLRGREAANQPAPQTLTYFVG
jgi:hypothetical protein